MSFDNEWIIDYPNTLWIYSNGIFPQMIDPEEKYQSKLNDFMYTPIQNRFIATIFADRVIAINQECN